MNGTSEYDYDYLVIGGGSGGLASAKRAASYGKRVAVIEKDGKLGGTCVNVGCVPKKIMFMAASIMDMIKHDASQYAFSGAAENVKFDWKTMKEKRDKYIVKLNGIYDRGLERNDVSWFAGNATFVNEHTVAVTDSDGNVKTITADKILVATGGRPLLPEGKGIEEHTITSNGFFELEELPPSVVVVGAGYIAVELAGVLNALGSDTHLVVRKEAALRSFDPDISKMLDSEMIRQGIKIHRNTNGVEKVELDEGTGKKKVTLKSGDVIDGIDTVLMAAGRTPNTETLNLEKAGVKVDNRNYIKVDAYQTTSADNIFALGDVCGAVELTPMAIAAGRRLSDRLFNGQSEAKVSYENVPTVVFSHPTIGTIGLSEPRAVEKYGEENVKIYKSKFVNLFYGIFAMESAEKPQTLMKIVTAGKDEKVVGMHVIGMGADEMMQGFGVAMKMGATKADLDSSVAIHPTAAEEFVTMGTWGTSPQATGAKLSPLMGAAPGEPELLHKSKM